MLSLVGLETNPLPEGGTSLSGITQALGADVVWEQSPFEWTVPEYFSVQRRYRTGPVERLLTSTTLEAKAGGTQVTVILEARTRSVVGKNWARVYLGIHMRAQLNRAMSRLCRLAEQGVEPRPVANHLEEAGHGALEEARLALGGRVPATLLDLLCHHIAQAPERELRRLRPFELARQWNVDRFELLRTCLHATWAQLLDISWDTVCPYCRRVARQMTSLVDLTSNQHCETCNLEWKADFSRTVEVTFCPSRRIRPTADIEWKARGPGASPHVLAQKRVAEGGTHNVALALPVGRYRVRSFQSPHAAHLEVVDDGQARAFYDLQETRDTEHRVTSTFELVISNPLETEALVLVERAGWLDDVASACVVTTQQSFRDLFATDGLSPGQRLDVGRLALLFTDLKDSTALYSTVGDDSAFTVVRKHFRALAIVIDECNGAVVKTIGDAVMAAFAHPVDALRAAERMHVAVAAIAPPNGTLRPLTLKVGLHSGACLAVRLNYRLDYFGTQVNLAARAQGESVGGDVVVTEEFARDPAVSARLDERAPHRERFTKKLKGIDDETALMRLRFELASQAGAA